MSGSLEMVAGVATSLPRSNAVEPRQQTRVTEVDSAAATGEVQQVEAQRAEKVEMKPDENAVSADTRGESQIDIFV